MVLTVYEEHLAGEQLHRAHYLAAISNYRRVAAEFAETLNREKVASIADVEEAGTELAKWERITEPDRMLPIRQVSELTGVPDSSLRHLCAEGMVKCEKRGKLWYLLDTEIERMLEKGDISLRPR